jgi:hypothetical protein
MEEKKTLTYEEFMTALEAQREESAKEVAELRELQKKNEEIQKKNEKIQKKKDEKFYRKLDRIAERLGAISDNIGHHAEQYFQDALSRKLEFGGEKYDKLIRNLKFEGKENSEFDIVLVNGKSIAIIEAKSRIHPDFIKIMTTKKAPQLRKYFPEYKDYKLYLGVAGFSFDDSVLEKAKESGIGIIRQVGEAVEMYDENLRVY